ncbi:MAG: DedA family protein [Spirochaetes bacterium]|nr:DedA family protein [Spirochaetota bacterium]
MEQLLNEIIASLMPRSDTILYLFLFLSALVENLVPPIPGDTILAFGAFLVGTGRLNYLLVYISTTTGSVAGFLLLVLVGRLLEREFFMKKNYRFFSAQSIASAEQWFSKYGYFVILVNRFLPGIRSVISLVSGIARLNLVYIFFLALASASVWNLIWIQAGYLLGNNWDLVKEKIGGIIKTYNITAGIIIAIGIAAFIAFKIIKGRK